MHGSIAGWTRQQKRRFRRRAQRVKDAHWRRRYDIVLHAVAGCSQRAIAAMLHCSLATVYETLRRFGQDGEAGLVDRRAENGRPKVTEAYIDLLLTLVADTPRDYGRRRPTWTLALLSECMHEKTGIAISITTMGRLLRALRVRRGQPRPFVECPWPAERRRRRIRQIQRLVDTLAPQEVAVWEDEMDLDLNPKIGADYMLPGQQKRVRTPGRNVKRYIAGALDARTSRITYVVAHKKRSELFIALLRQLLKTYAHAARIHIILDNYVIHSSRRTQAFIASTDGRIVLHFLPPYCPDDNRIERAVWREVHANVTRNHRCENMDELVKNVCDELAARNRRAAARCRRTAPLELREAI